MVLEGFLQPNETTQYHAPTRVEYQGEEGFDFYITNSRLIWHRTKGRVFKKEALIAAVKENIREVKYEERGLISKKASIKLMTKDEKSREIIGSRSTIRAIYSEMQAYMTEPGN